MRIPNEPLISIQREWNGWRTAQVRLGALESIHWHQPSGAPKPLLHGYVSCEEILAGDIEHECAGQPRHRLLVCVLKSHTACAVYAALANRADEQRRDSFASATPAH
jgi:hypothetical protein